MRVIGLSKVRNEELIIKTTLNHWSKYCDEFIIVDECSTDKTVEICRSHPKVREVIERSFWDQDREKAEWVNRQIALDAAKKNAKSDDWFIYFDADEYIYDFSLNDLKGCEAIVCKLFDVYITPEDKNISWQKREWIGPEYRKIIFFFKNSPLLNYYLPDQREVSLPASYRLKERGTIKHFGKALSEKHWEETCQYYIQYWPKYMDKWQARLGKAIHTKSDFNNQLIKWPDRHKRGIPL